MNTYNFNLLTSAVWFISGIILLFTEIAYCAIAYFGIAIMYLFFGINGRKKNQNNGENN